MTVCSFLLSSSRCLFNPCLGVQRVLSEVAKSTNDGIIYDVLVDKGGCMPHQLLTLLLTLSKSISRYFTTTFGTVPDPETLFGMQSAPR